MRQSYSYLVSLCLVVWPIASQAAAPLCAPSPGLTASSSLEILPEATVVAPWTNETPRELRSVETVDGRTAMRVDMRNWSPVAVDDSGRITSGDHEAIELWLRTDQAAPALTVIGDTGVACSLDAFAIVQADTWQRVQIPLSSLGYDSEQSVGRIKLKSTVSESYTVWVTGLRLIGSDEAGVLEPGHPAQVPEVESEPQEPIEPSPASDIDLSLWRRDPGVDGLIDDHLPASRVHLLTNGVDGQDDTQAFQQALSSMPAGGGVLEIPAGVFYLSASLRLRSGQVLLGSGSSQTRLIFTRSLNQGIEIGGGYPGARIEVFDARNGSANMSVGSRSELRTGLYGLISDSGGAASQVVRIIDVRIDGPRARLQLDEPLNNSFSTDATLQVFDAVEHAGIEDLSLDVASPEVRIGDMIMLRSAANSWVRNVVSRRAFSAHIFTRQSYHCEIRDSLFDDATGHHDGKQGYGIDLANSTTGCLVENNVLRRLRHSILLQAGANGNVVALNHSAEPRHTNFARGGPGDISFHGAANSNLIEANVVERIHIGDAGPVGHGNAVLRNCLTSGPMTLENVPALQYIAGNAMYGSDAQLMNTFMPAVLPQMPQARAYIEPNERLFDDDGVVFTSTNAEQPVLLGNWYAQQRWSGSQQAGSQSEIPRTLYGRSGRGMLNDPISGYWPDDCLIPAVERMNMR